MAYRHLRGVGAALDTADARQQADHEAVEKQMQAGEKAEVPPPPEHAGPAPKQKKKKRFADRVAIDGEILAPAEKPKPKLEYRPPQQEVGPALVFPVETAEKVFNLARYGMKPYIIARHIDNPIDGKPISEDILMRYFGNEATAGARQGAIETAKSIHEQVTGEGGAKRSPSVAMFRAKQDEFVGFKDVTEVVHTTKEAEQLRQRIEQLDDDDIFALRAILAKRIDSGASVARTPRVPRRGSGDEDDRESSE